MRIVEALVHSQATTITVYQKQWAQKSHRMHAFLCSFKK